jgi:hypothetical protein
MITIARTIEIREVIAAMETSVAPHRDAACGAMTIWRPVSPRHPPPVNRVGVMVARG